MFVVCLLALSVSLDTLGIGMAYAMSGICIPKRIRLFIALLNGVLTAVALFAGSCCKTKGKYSMTKIIPEALI